MQLVGFAKTPCTAAQSNEAPLNSWHNQHATRTALRAHPFSRFTARFETSGSSGRMHCTRLYNRSSQGVAESECNLQNGIG